MRLKEKYTKEIVPTLKEKFNHKNTLAVPKIVKVIVNVGLGVGVKDANYADLVAKTLRDITGQNPIRVKAKKSISGFKVREGMIVGMMVTLRGQKMYDFMDKLINISIPRIRDFRGIALSTVDKSGNLNLGFKEHIIFPEIRMDNVDRIHGLQVTASTSAKTREEGLELFKLLGVPFKKK